MLEELKLKNFRCFKDYKIKFDKFNVIVGRNNIGKSTIIDAIKLVSNVRRYAPYRDYYLGEKDIPFSQINLRYDYVEEDSVVYSRFSDNTEINIVFPIDDRPYTEFFKDGRGVSDKTLLRRYFKHSLGVIPPVGAFEEYEKLGDRKYLLSVLISHLTPRHFRNIWYYFGEEFEEFREIIEETWPGYVIEPPEFHSDENRINMFFRENGITREIFWAGHGFQVWLQLMTFLVKLGRMETLILDEPDIYLHSDMQKKLVNICKERANQVIIATHAVDIIEEVEPDDIISIDKNSNEARRLSNIDEVQTCITQLGSFQNLKLVHFVRGKSCLFVEGNDFRYLRILARKLNFDSFVREDGFSVIPLEGFSNWDRLLYVGWVFKNAFGERVKCYVVLDKDYYTSQEIDEIVSNLQKKGVGIHVWERKEIENYIINYDALYRMFKSRFSKRHIGAEIPLSKKEFDKKIESIFEELKNDVQSQIIARRIRTRPDKSVDASTVVADVLKEFQDRWRDKNYRRKTIPGKEFFARLNAWLNDEYHITIPVGYAFNSLKSDEIETEIRNVISDFIQLVNS